MLKYLVSLFLSAIIFVAIAQEKHTISGYVKDGDTGEDIISAVIYAQEKESGTATNMYGFYSLSLPNGAHTLRVSSLGYQDKVISINLSRDTTIKIELFPEGVLLDEVVVSAEKKDKNVTSIEMSTIEVPIEAVKKMPQLLGEVDVIRSLTMLPGVSTVGEGATGFNVRGGNADQNLILLDEATVYNSSHFFGFFSVFNADAVKDVKLYKGGIPARYGGRLSSVLDVRQRDGNKKQFKAMGGIGLISSRLTLEAPIIKEKSSFIISGRRSYADVFLRLSNDESLNNNIVYFYDLNMKADYIINDNNKLFISGYFGKDVFNFGEDFTSNWGNFTTTLRWNHIVSDKLFSNYSLIFSQYDYSLGIPEGSQAFDWTSKIISYNLKADYSYYLNPENKIEFGANAILYTFQPGNVVPGEDNSIFNAFQLENEHAIEPAVYISNEQKVTDRLTLQYGLRYSHFLKVGEQSVFTYEDENNRTEESLNDTLEFDSWEKIASYGGLEPRLSVNYLLNEKSSVKASYNRMRQYLHLVSNTTAPTPLDIWTSSGYHIKPAIADQIAAGYFRNFKDNTFEASVEVYYKWFRNLVDYVDNAELLLNETLETELIQGDGRAYGLEFLVRKDRGRFTGWLSYTLSRTERQIKGINNNDWYPSNYDKTHDVSMTGTYSLNDKWDISANFSYYTGRPITYPDGKVIYENIVYPIYGNRNGARTPDYHRLDISAIYNKPKKEGKRWESSWVFGVYNVYARRNPYSIFFRSAENSQNTEAVRLSIFGSIIPSITYNFNY